MAVANTLAYYDMATITVVKSFIVQVLGQIIIDILALIEKKRYLG
jgi:hypothetical protein